MLVDEVMANLGRWSKVLTVNSLQVNDEEEADKNCSKTKSLPGKVIESTLSLNGRAAV
jgi:hypothetical protein